MHTGVQWGNLMEEDHFKDPVVEGRIILKWILENWDWGHGLDRSGSVQGQGAGYCKCVNEPSGSIKCGEFFQ